MADINELTQVFLPLGSREASKPLKKIAKFVEANFNDGEVVTYRSDLCRMNIRGNDCAIIANDDSWVIRLWFNMKFDPPRFMEWAANGEIEVIDNAIESLLTVIE